MNTAEEFWNHVQVTNRCWEWQGGRFNGKYGRVRWKGQYMAAHRCAWMLSHQEQAIPGGLLVCHHCDNIVCCRPEHLFLGTNQDNQDDAKRKGRTVKGRTQTAAHVEARMQHHRGRKRSAESCQKMRDSRRRLFLTYRVSDETRARLTQARRQWWKDRQQTQPRNVQGQFVRKKSAA